MTSGATLRDNIGRAEAEHLIGSLRAMGEEVYDGLPAVGGTMTSSAASVRERLRAEHAGVVILGGYDAVPAQKLDVLDAEIRRRLPAHHHDQDDFVVWSDEVYGDRDGDGLPEVPVTRIPDGKSAQLVFTAIQAGPRRAGSRRFVVRNIARPFANEVFRLVPGTGELQTSEPTVPTDILSRLVSTPTRSTSCCTVLTRTARASGVRIPTDGCWRR